MANKDSETPAVPVAPLDHQNTVLEDILEKHLKKIIIVVGIVLVAVVAWLVMKHFQKATFEKQSAAFTSAKTIENYRQVIADFPSTVAAGNAQLMIGKLQQKDKKSAEAAGSLESFVKSYPDHPLRDQGILQLAALALSEGKPEECLTFSKQLVSDHPNSAHAPMALIYQGDIAFASGDKEAASAIYKGILPKYPGTVYEGLISERLEKSTLIAPTVIEFVPEPEPDTRPVTAPLLPGVTPQNLFEADAPAGESTPAATTTPAE